MLEHTDRVHVTLRATRDTKRGIGKTISGRELIKRHKQYEDRQGVQENVDLGFTVQKYKNKETMYTCIYVYEYVCTYKTTTGIIFSFKRMTT